MMHNDTKRGRADMRCPLVRIRDEGKNILNDVDIFNVDMDSYSGGGVHPLSYLSDKGYQGADVEE